MTRPARFESWGLAVANCNYVPFKRITGERDKNRTMLPCGRSVCSRCQANCDSQPH